MMIDKPQREEVPAENPGKGAAAARVWQSTDLFADQRAIIIQHAGLQYRQLITRNDRLMLPK